MSFILDIALLGRSNSSLLDYNPALSLQRSDDLSATIGVLSMHELSEN